MRLPFEAFLALRYLRPRRTFVSVITVISIIGVMLGVAVLIVVIAVMSGFDREWRTRILGFNAHLKISQPDEPLEDFTRIMTVVASNKHVQGVAPFVRGQVLVKTQPQTGHPKVAAPVLRGIDPLVEGKVSVLPRSIKAGAFDVSGNGLLIGREFAQGMELDVGDRVAVYSPSNLQKMEATLGKPNEEKILPNELVVRGIFDVGFSEYNASFIITSLENAQDLYDLPEDAVHGLQVMLHDPFDADLVRAQLLPQLGRGFAVLTWPEENPQLFNALAVEKNMMFFLLFFIMIVAAFGIVNCQITFVVQKTHEIGILKALGASNRQVLWLFLSQSIVVGFLGVGLGFVVAMLALSYRNEFLALMNRLTGFELLPASIYQIYELPAAIEFPDILVICGTAFVTCVLAGLFPAWKAARLQPVEALRYE
jgi:lipoprotein-releasing system permease protein